MLRAQAYLLPCLLATALLSLVRCQGQPPSDAPISICAWTEVRAAIVRDQIYFDGGQLYYQEANFDPWSSFQGSMYMNLNTSFDLATSNLTTLLMPVVNGSAAKDSCRSGYMFADEYQFYLYGGLLNSPVGDEEALPKNWIFGYVVHARDDTAILEPMTGPAGRATVLPSGLTRYVTNGAGVSVPSEELGFYFGGMTNPAEDEFDLGTAQNPSEMLVEVNMSTPIPTWSNRSLPESVKSRADAQLLWIPVSNSGVLIAIGGVINPEELFFESLNSTQVKDSQRVSPGFMSTIPVYDIASKRWFLQHTVGPDRPGQLTQFCAVVATSSASSAYDIYIYGGYNGLVGAGINAILSSPSDDVWVLSVPSFTWTRVNSGDAVNGRSGHSCFLPYPDQMFSIGGAYFEGQCLGGSFIRIFNLNTLQWQDTYDPTIWNEYATPEVVYRTIEAYGPFATDMDPALVQIFKTPYQKPIPVYYPYVPSTSITKEVENFVKQALASWLGGLLSIVIYLFLSTICIVVIVLVRRRIFLHRIGAETMVSSDHKTSRFIRWFNNMKVDGNEEDALMKDHGVEDATLKYTAARQRRARFGNMFSRRHRFSKVQETTPLGRNEDNSAKSEVHELRTRPSPGTEYTQVSLDAEDEWPSEDVETFQRNSLQPGSVG